MKITSIFLFYLSIVCHAQTLKPPHANQVELNAESLIETPKLESIAVKSDEPAAKRPRAAVQPSETNLGKETQSKPLSGLQKTADEGIQIYVEKSSGKSGLGKLDGEVRVYSPWPSKPLFPAPLGWKYAPAPKGVSPYRTNVKLGSGREVSLAVTPYVLTPDANGFTSLSVKEPGYQAELGYSQSDTIGATLRKSNADIEKNEKLASESISRLQQLLSTLPRAAVSSASEPQPDIQKP